VSSGHEIPKFGVKIPFHDRFVFDGIGM